jgi:hypothetical protein
MFCVLQPISRDLRRQLYGRRRGEGVRRKGRRTEGAGAQAGGAQRKEAAQPAITAKERPPEKRPGKH